VAGLWVTNKVFTGETQKSHIFSLWQDLPSAWQWRANDGVWFGKSRARVANRRNLCRFRRHKMAQCGFDGWLRKTAKAHNFTGWHENSVLLRLKIHVLVTLHGPVWFAKFRL